MTTKIKILYLVFAFILIDETTIAQQYKTNLQTYELINNLLTKDGKIMVINEVNKDKIGEDSYIILNDKGKIITKGDGYKHYNSFGKQILVHYNSAQKTLEILDTYTLKETLHNNIMECTLIEECNVIFFYDLKTDSYNLYNPITNIYEWTAPKKNIDFISISNAKQSIIIQYKNKQQGIDYIELPSLKISNFNNFNDSIKRVVWDEIHPVVFLLSSERGANNLKHITFLNYQTKSLKKQSLDSLLFYSNPQATGKNSFKLRYHNLINTQHKNNNDLKIWSTNNYNLNSPLTKNASPGKYTQGHLIFDYEKNEITETSILNGFESIPVGEDELLIYNPNQYLDYTHKWISRPRDISIYNILYTNQTLISLKQYDPINTTSLSPLGNYFIFIKDHLMHLYNIKNKEIETTFALKDDKANLQISNKTVRYWTKDEKFFYYIDNSTLKRYDTEKKTIEVILKSNNKAIKYEIINKQLNTGYNNSQIHSKSISDYDNLLIETLEVEHNLYSLILIKNGIKNYIIKDSKDYISDINYSEDYETITYSRENFNLPKSIYIYKKGQTKLLYKNRTSSELYDWKKQTIVSYKDDAGNSLKGILFYPKNFNPNNKYPLITSVYEIQYHLANKYNSVTLQNPDGFNVDLYLERDYFVFLPDILTTDKGPGLSALNCIEESIRVITKKEKSIDKQRLGLIGYSFGGYVTNFIITQSHLFKAAVSGSGITDIISSYFSYNKEYISPNYFIFENGQMNMPEPVNHNSINLYLNNSPIIFADNIKTPLLSFTGKNDKVVDWNQQSQFFIALLRNKQPHISLYYDHEQHGLREKKNQIDITNRIINWFDYFLKNDINDNNLWIQSHTTFAKR